MKEEVRRSTKHEAWDFRARDDVMCRGPGFGRGEKGVDGDGMSFA